MRTAYLAVAVSFLAAAGMGCSSRSLSNTPRTAVEQLLLTAAVDRAMEKFELPEANGHRIWADFSNLGGIDKEYVKVAVRARLAQLGAILVDAGSDADYIAEIASGSLGTEYKTFLLGIPAFPVPNSPVPFPEAALYRTVEQTGIVKLMIFVHSEGRFVSLAHYYAKADRDETFLLWYRFQQHDDVRRGWEKADLRLAEQFQEPAGQVEQAADGPQKTP